MHGDAVMLVCPTVGWETVMFPDANDLCWVCYPTQVSPEGFASGVAVEDTRHKPLAFFSGQLKDVKLR